MQVLVYIFRMTVLPQNKTSQSQLINQSDVVRVHFKYID